MQGRADTMPSDVRINAMLDGLRMGYTRRAAAGAAGFSKSTLYRMLDLDDGTLLDTIERAEAEAEAAFASKVALAADDPKNWTAAAWWLERRRHMDYARRDKVEMSIDLKTVSARIAQESGLDADAVMAEAERVVAGER